MNFQRRRLSLRVKPGKVSKQVDSFEIGTYLETQRATVDSHLDRFLPPEDEYPEVIHRAMRYSVFAGGKRVRPILALAASEAVGGDFERTVRLACALELIHTYSLIHDDLPAMDDDDHRRGRLTCHKVFGEGIAILAGNGLMAHAFQLLTEIPGDVGFSATKIEVLNGLCRAIGTQCGVIAGQVVDLVTEGKPFSAKELEYIHSSKTGALIEASVFCSAVLARADEKYLQCLKTFGLKVGLAFQIVDDILDMEGSREELGKTPGKDMVEQKATYPALYGVQKSREAVHSLVEEAIAAIECLGDKGVALRELARFISIRRF